MALSASARPIEGAVATLGVSDRVTFLRKTYAHLGGALIAFALITAGLIKFATAFSLRFSETALQGRWSWLVVIGVFMLVNMGAQKLAQSETSRGLQYVGLAVTVAAWSMIFQPMIWIAMIKFGDPFAAHGPLLSAQAGSIILQSAIITLAIFTGLTLTVFITKKDFSFMRGALTMATFAALGVIIASAVFGFNLGSLFSGLMILLMAGYILYQTSLVMSYFPPTAYVAAALMLFGTVAQLFWYVLRIMMSMNSRR